MKRNVLCIARRGTHRRHRKLFQGIYKYAGKIRDYNITKKEWVLDGATVMYGSATELKKWILKNKKCTFKMEKWTLKVFYYRSKIRKLVTGMRKKQQSRHGLMELGKGYAFTY